MYLTRFEFYYLILFIISLIMCILKILGYLKFSWWIVLMPLYLPFIILIASFLVIFSFALLIFLISKMIH